MKKVKFLSPGPELVLFFGMISADTDGLQVRFRQLRTKVWLCSDKGYQLTDSGGFTAAQCPLPYMGFTWDWKLSEVYQRATLVWRHRSADTTSALTANHKDWKDVSFQKWNKDFLKKAEVKIFFVYYTSAKQLNVTITLCWFSILYFAQY